MSALLLGVPLELALQELVERGVTQVAVNRLLAPKRGAHASSDTVGQWRVVRVREENAVILDVCGFAEGAHETYAAAQPPQGENDRVGGD